VILAAEVRGDIFDKILEPASRGRAAVSQRQELLTVADARTFRSGRLTGIPVKFGGFHDFT
jgi:hypothetical protein